MTPTWNRRCRAVLRGAATLLAAAIVGSGCATLTHEGDRSSEAASAHVDASTVRAQSPEVRDEPAAPTRTPGPGAGSVTAPISVSDVRGGAGVELSELPPLPPVLNAPTPANSADAVMAHVTPEESIVSEGVEQARCATCGGSGLSAPGPGVASFSRCASCGGSGCVPGRKNTPPIEYHTFLGRFCGNLYECLCCPDPCYDPVWVPAANASFFTDYARPRTIQRFRYDRVWDYQFPDRSEYFWARERVPNPQGAISPGLGPGPGTHSPKGFRSVNRGGVVRRIPLYRGVPSLTYNELYYYQEAATARASVFTEIGYRNMTPILNDFQSGFSDIKIGTKGMFLDCELLQLTFQFVTDIPLGPSTKGLSNGHVSLEPSLLGALRLAPDTYLQGQVAEWIPIGGDLGFQGPLVHYQFALNQVLYKMTPETQLIGTLEFMGYSFQSGAYTNPFSALTLHPSSGDSFFGIGPGLRATICNRVDFGGAVAYPVSTYHMANPWLRLELRVLF